MTGKLPKSASVAHTLHGAKLHAPAAERNASVLCNLLIEYAPEAGQALELASGTGQHVVQFARACPGLTWQPTELENDRIASIAAYIAESDVTNVLNPVFLDATVAGWAGKHAGLDLIVLVNLLHLLSEPAAEAVTRNAMRALRDGGRFILYGPFKRQGTLISAGDQKFDAQLRGSDPAIGYKDSQDIEAALRAAGASLVQQREMPANNLAFVVTR
ncbi:MAG: DUF938 domain-containing protein [Pseudomonadota bacterium]